MKVIIETRVLPCEEAKKKADILLEECLYLLNKIPNRKYRPKSFSNTYELASKISEYLK